MKKTEISLGSYIKAMKNIDVMSVGILDSVLHSRNGDKFYTIITPNGNRHEINDKLFAEMKFEVISYPMYFEAAINEMDFTDYDSGKSTQLEVCRQFVEYVRDHTLDETILKLARSILDDVIDT